MAQSEPVPPTTAPAPRKGNGYGIAALVLGIVALIGAFIPLLNYVSIVLAAIGIILAIVGLIVKRRSRGAAIAGLILSIIALILSIIMVVIYAAAGHAIDNAVNAPHKVVYTVTGNSTDAIITYTTWDGKKLGEEQATGQALPFTKDVTTRGSFGGLTLSATTGTTGNTITCKITVDGKQVSKQTSTGTGATATCTG